MMKEPSQKPSKEHSKEYSKESYEVLIIGGGAGGVAAALALAKLGHRVLLSEASDWLGGQLTSQGVPPDEHPWIEAIGATGSYRRFREGVRQYYRQHYPLKPSLKHKVQLNPGGGFVSRLCYEPKVAVAVLEAMLMPYIAAGRLIIKRQHKPVAVEMAGDRILAVALESSEGEKLWLRADYVLDASELGEVLELSHTEHVIGAESQQDSGELHAPAKANP
ncbi:MAG: FAD-dependent oxidoreductase [Deinococcales bacterium]